MNSLKRATSDLSEKDGRLLPQPARQLPLPQRCPLWGPKEKTRGFISIEHPHICPPLSEELLQHKYCVVLGGKSCLGGREIRAFVFPSQRCIAFFLLKRRRTREKNTDDRFRQGY